MRVLDILLPVISDDLVISPFITSKIVISFTMGYGISQFVFGALGDKFGKTNVIRYAVLISCISSFVSFYFDNLNHLFFLMTWLLVITTGNKKLVPPERQ